MITAEQAYNIILEQKINYGSEYVNLSASLGRILHEDIHSDRDLPPFDRICMDGIAIHSDSYHKGQRDYCIEGMQAAGMAQKSLERSDQCFEVATGAVLPKNTDTIIPYEKLRIENGIARVLEEIQPLGNIHQQAIDRKKGALLIKKNKRISFAEIGALASVGKAIVKVAKNPKILILSTGDELVDIEKSPETHQIRKSNVHVIQSLLSSRGVPSHIEHIRDDAKDITDRFQKHFNEYDVLILSGAVSKGKYDFIPPTFEKMKVDKLFHRIQQRPGKPMWFGRKNDVLIFAFPGNPVSSFVCAQKYFTPWLDHVQGLNTDRKQYARLAEDFEFKPELTYFLQVTLENSPTDGTILARPAPGKGSGDFSNLVDVDAFVELPSSKVQFKKGEVFPIIKIR